MTAADRKKLAKAARELAMECVAGTAPEFGLGVEFHSDGTPSCAIGHVVARAGFHPKPDWLYVFGELVALPVPQNIVTRFNDVLPERDGLPWALLYLADELESAP